jgi:hypothetical protein
MYKSRIHYNYNNGLVDKTKKELIMQVNKLQ